MRESDEPGDPNGLGRTAGVDHASDDLSGLESALHPERPAPYGLVESRLGVATNRSRHRGYESSPTAVSFYSLDTDVAIDIENDPDLVDFLSSVREAVAGKSTPGTREQAEMITRQVVAQTPQIDEDDSLHAARSIKLGAALKEPVQCIDRCLAMDASLKMFGFNDAQHLESIGTDIRTGEQMGHVDVIFTISDQVYVAPTMTEYAGRVFTWEEYVGDFLPWREQQGRRYKVAPIYKPESYFQSVETK